MFKFKQIAPEEVLTEFSKLNDIAAPAQVVTTTIVEENSDILSTSSGDEAEEVEIGGEEEDEEEIRRVDSVEKRRIENSNSSDGTPKVLVRSEIMLSGY